MSNLTIIDVSAWVYRHFYALPAMARSDGQQVNAVHGCVNSLWNILRSNPDHIVAVFDAAKKTWRNDVYEDYKANRPPAKPELSSQFPLVKQAIDALDVHRIEHVGFEADDVIATLCRLALDEGLNVTIVSSDKDLKQLITQDVGVRMFDPMKNALIGPDEVEAKHGVRPRRMGDFLALMGDASDNIPGVPQIGEKTAAKLLNEFGDLEAVLQAAQELAPNMAKKAQTQLNLFAKDAMISKVLVELKSDVPIELELDKMKVRAPDGTKVSDFLDLMELVTLRETIFGQVAA